MTNRQTIKFRIWDSAKKEFTTEFPRLRYDHKQDAFEIGDKNIAICMFTGVLDKYNKEIYEGDLIKYHRGFEREREIRELTSHIKFQDGAFGFDMNGFNDLFMALDDDNDIEVIGNIFEL